MKFKTNAFFVMIAFALTGCAGPSQGPAQTNKDTEVVQSTATAAPTTETTLPIIDAGTYLVGSEILPGAYRVAGYWERLDLDGEIIDNDGVYEAGEFSYLLVKSTDAFVKISGEAVEVAAFRKALGGPYDPIRANVQTGTYIVNEDVVPGRYRVTNADYAYAARLTCDRDIIDNDGGEGSVIIVVKKSDCLFQFTGTLTRID